MSGAVFLDLGAALVRSATVAAVSFERADTRVRFDVLGTPAPKGSGRAMLIGGKARFVAGGSAPNARNLRSWDTAVKQAACDAHARSPATSGPVFVATPLRVVIEFRMRRPSGHWCKRGLRASAPAFPASKPDIDKLARATLDSLTGCIFDDDSRIVELTVTKVWAAPVREGATITVEAM